MRQHGRATKGMVVNGTKQRATKGDNGGGGQEVGIKVKSGGDCRRGTPEGGGRGLLGESTHTGSTGGEWRHSRVETEI
jgi:hypothetical protein